MVSNKNQCTFIQSTCFIENYLKSTLIYHHLRECYLVSYTRLILNTVVPAHSLIKDILIMAKKIQG